MIMQFVTERRGADERRLTILVPGPDGEDMRIAQIDYTRRR